VQNIQIYPQTKVPRKIRHIRVSDWIPETIFGHVRPSSSSSATKSHLDLSGPKKGYRNSNRTCPTSQPYPGFRPGTGLVRFPSRVPEWFIGHVRPRPGHVWVSNNLTGRFPLGGYKWPPCLSSPVGHSVQLANSLRYSFLSSKPLSLKLHSNLIFL
jgi:hypothetical protein